MSSNKAKATVSRMGAALSSGSCAQLLEKLWLSPSSGHQPTRVPGSRVGTHLQWEAPPVRMGLGPGGQAPGLGNKEPQTCILSWFWRQEAQGQDAAGWFLLRPREHLSTLLTSFWRPLAIVGIPRLLAVFPISAFLLMRPSAPHVCICEQIPLYGGTQVLLDRSEGVVAPAVWTLHPWGQRSRPEV